MILVIEPHILNGVASIFLYVRFPSLAAKTAFIAYFHGSADKFKSLID
jgi:hypothetical protein